MVRARNPGVPVHPSTPLPRRSLRWRLVLLLGAVLGIVAAGVALFHLSARQRMRQQVWRNLETIADLKETQILRWRIERLDDGRVLSLSNNAARQVAALLAHPRDAASEASVREWLELMMGDRYVAAAIVDRDLQLRIGIGLEESQLPPRLANNVRRALGTREVMLTPLHQTEWVPTPHLELLVPIFPPRPAGRATVSPEEEPVAVVVLRIDPSQVLLPIVAHWPKASDTGETLLVQVEEGEVVFLNRLRHEPSGPLSHRVSIEVDIPAARAARGEAGVCASLDYRGEPVLAALRKIPESPWCLVVKIDEAEAYAPVVLQTWIVAGGIFLLLLVIGGGVAFYWQVRHEHVLQDALAIERENRRLAEHLALLTRHANDIVLLLDETGRVIEANERALATYGYSLAELQQLPPGGLRAEGREETAEDLERLNSLGGAVFETTHRRRDGTTFPVEISGRAVDLDGRRMVLGIYRDITERKRTEGILRESEARYRSLFENNHAVMLLVDPVAGVIVDGNKAACDFYGWTRAQLQGRKISDVNTLPPEEIGRALEFAQRQQRSSFQFVHRLADGSTRDVELFSGPIVVEGRPLLYSIVHDISERRRIEQALRVSERRWQFALEGSGDGVWETNLETGESFYSSRWKAMLGYADDEIGATQEAWWNLVHPEDRPRVRQEMERYLAAREGLYTCEYRMQAKGGSYRWILARGSKLEDGRRIIGTHTDITARKETAQQVADALALFQTVFDSSPIGMVICLESGPVVNVNAALAKMSGSTEGELRRLNFRELDSWRRQGMLECAEQALASGKEVRHEGEVATAAGNRLFLEMSFVPFRFQGETRLLALFRDATQRRQALLALRESEQRWQFALEGAGQGVWDWNVETGDAFFSAQLAGLFGYSPSEIAGRIEEWEMRVHPDDQAAVRERLAACLAGGMPHLEVEHRVRGKDGNYRWILSRGMVVTSSADGRPSRIIGTFSDLTAQKEAERERRDLLERLTRIADNIPGVIYQYRLRPDGTSHFPYASVGLRDIYGLSPEEVQTDASGVFAVLHPDDRARVASSIEDSARTLTTWNDTYRVNLPAGKTIWVRGQSSPQKLEDGSILWHGYIHDVTDRMRAEDDYEMLFRSMLEGFALHEMIYDAEGRPVDYRFLRVNPAFERMTGLRAQEVVGRTAREVMPTLSQEWIDRYGTVAKTGEPAFFTNYAEHLGRHFEVAAFRPEENHFACIFTDVTERHKASERMALLDTALQAMPAGIVITDKDGHIQWANHGFTQLTGYGLDEAVGGKPNLLKSGRHAVDFYARLWDTILKGQVWSGELVNRRKDGTEYTERMVIAPVSHEKTGITHFIAVKQDITEQKQMERQLLRSQRMEGIGLLAGGIAHDLNNVLAPILLSAELLRATIEQPALRRSLDVIEAAARRGAGVVRQVLTFARGIDGERAPLRLRDVVRELVMIIEETFPRDIEIRRVAGERVSLVLGDTTQLHQVLLNLAVNARDAMPNGGQLTFEVKAVDVPRGRSSLMGEVKPGRYVMLSVRDTGEGMSPEVRDRLFEPFFTTKPRGKGTGLGLATVLGIVRSHGGFVEVDSAVGVGSDFRVYLPAIDEEETDVPALSAPAALAGEGRTVLVCDDEAPIRELAALMLRQRGFLVLEATNGQEALATYLQHEGQIHAVVIDIMMPLMTGDRAAAEMLRREPGLPVLFMSGLMEQDAVQAALHNLSPHKVSLLRKPFTVSDFFQTIGELLKGRSV